MYTAIVSVRANDDFSLSVAFNDGAEGILDMRPYLSFGIFKRIGDIAAFKQVRIAFDTVEWPCGADLDPEFVRAKCKIVKTA